MIDYLRNALSKYAPPGYFTLLIYGLPNYESVIDLGCGPDSVLKSFNNKYKFGVDLFEDYLKISSEKRIHHSYLLEDVLSPKVSNLVKDFDAVVCFDVVEHLKDNDAIDFVKSIEESQPKFIAFRTTSTYIEQDEYHNNPYQVHQSFLSPDFFKQRGYHVYGVDGPNFILVKDRRVQNNLPSVVRIIGFLLRPIFYFLPSKSLNYIAVKKI